MAETFQRDPATSAATLAAARKAVSVADMMMETSLDMQKYISSVDTAQEADMQAQLDAKQAAQGRAEINASINLQSLLNYGVDMSNPDNLLVQQARQRQEISARRMQLSNEIDRRAGLTPWNDPLAWLESQFTTSAIVRQHNSLANTENNLGREMDATLAAAKQYGEAWKSSLNPASPAEKAAELSTVTMLAKAKEFDTRMKAYSLQNDAGIHTTELLQKNAHLLSADESANMQTALANMQADARNERLAHNAAFRLSAARAGQMLGMTTDEYIVRTERAEPKVKEALYHFATSGNLGDANMAALVMQEANFDGLKFVATQGVTPEDRKLASSMLTLLEDIGMANTKFDSEMASRGYVSVGMSDGSSKNFLAADYNKAKNAEDKAEFKAPFMDAFIKHRISERARLLTPVDMANAGIPLAKEFPEVVPLLQLPQSAVNNNMVLEAFLTAAENNPTLAAKRFAEYNRMRLAAIHGANISMKAGVEAPVGIISGDTEFEQMKLFSHAPSYYKMVMTNSASVEHYLRTRMSKQGAAWFKAAGEN